MPKRGGPSGRTTAGTLRAGTLRAGPPRRWAGPTAATVGAGAILQVVYEVSRLLLKDSQRSKRKRPALSASNLGGLTAGVAVTYATALLVSV